MWAETCNLWLAEDGRLWQVLRDEAGDYAGMLPLGPIGEADAPEGLAEELAALRDRWEAADDARELHEEWDWQRRSA